MNIFVFGTSHVHCLAEAIEQQAFTVPADDRLEIVDIRTLGAETVDISGPLIAHMMERAQPGRHIIWFSRLGGNEHNILGLVRYPRAFDVILPEQPDLPLDANAELLTYGYVAEAMRRHVLMQRYLAILKRMRDSVNAPLYHIESPPPKRDDRFIRDHLDPLLQRAVDNGQEPPDIVSQHLRFKLWRIHSRLVQEECQKLNVGYLLTPPEVMDDMGFLRPEGYASDATHGNAWYGAQILALAVKTAHPEGLTEETA